MRYSRVRLRVERSDQGKVLDSMGMRTDGIFIGQQLNGSVDTFRGEIILYRNGVMSGSVGSYHSTIEEIIDYYENPENAGYHQGNKNMVYHWGVYEIKEDCIAIEKWLSQVGIWKYQSARYSGRIVDSTSFVLKFPADGDSIRYHFYPLKNKPDSTNNFIK